MKTVIPIAIPSSARIPRAMIPITTPPIVLPKREKIWLILCQKCVQIVGRRRRVWCVACCIKESILMMQSFAISGVYGYLFEFSDYTLLKNSLTYCIQMISIQVSLFTSFCYVAWMLPKIIKYWWSRIIYERKRIFHYY